RRPCPRFLDLSPDEVADMFQTAHRVGKVIEREYHATSLTIACQDGPNAGQTVPHVHVHIIPRRLGDYIDNDEIYADITRHTQNLCLPSSPPRPSSAVPFVATKDARASSPPSSSSSSSISDAASIMSTPELLPPLDTRIPGDDQDDNTPPPTPSPPSSPRAIENEGLTEAEVATATVNYHRPPQLSLPQQQPQQQQQQSHHHHHHRPHHVNVSALPVAKKGVDNDDRRARTAAEMAEEATRLSLLFDQD
ncbi:hypothetical protein DFQ27_007956, partial [Actinomortierella ambigua]